MAKTYIDIVKYMVEAKFEINGLVDRPDIIGAVFGQTEGLLGGNLDLRELQKNGKIGRIEIDSSASGSKTSGKLHLPSSLSRVETCILAAAIESVDRVGPFETNFKVEKIEDTRSAKRKKIIDRAKELVKTLLSTEIPDSKEISDMVESDVKSSTVGTYGSENLPAGPDIAKSDEVIIVEGRADVINLLKSDIDNCIAVGGASGSVPKTIIDLCAAKDSTVFVDGDRGGDMIIRGIAEVADIDFIAKAPDGKEVEELTRKEIIKALRTRIPMEQYLHNSKGKEQQSRNSNQKHYQDSGRRTDNFRNNEQNRQRQDTRQQQQPRQQQDDNAIISPSKIVSNLEKHDRQLFDNEAEQEPRNAQAQAHTQKSDFGIQSMEEEEVREGLDSIPKIEQPKNSRFPDKMFIDALSELHNTLRGRLYKTDGTVIEEMPIRELVQALQNAKDAYAVVFDGIITQRLIDLAYKSGVKEIYGIRSSYISRAYPDLGMYTTENGVIG
ncbi:MAG: DNA primase DnaG [Candidatus Micrarchaeaceae archaeon]